VDAHEVEMRVLGAHVDADVGRRQRCHALAAERDEVVRRERTHRRHRLADPIAERSTRLHRSRLVGELPRHDGGVVAVRHARERVGALHDVPHVLGVEPPRLRPEEELLCVPARRRRRRRRWRRWRRWRPSQRWRPNERGGLRRGGLGHRAKRGGPKQGGWSVGQGRWRSATPCVNQRACCWYPSQLPPTAGGGYGMRSPATHDTYCAKPPDHGHMLPSISTAVMSRFAISASR
jgi:hypothetical protein